MEYSVARMDDGVTVAELRVGWKTSFGETKIVGNGVLPLFICWGGYWTQSLRSLLKRDPRNASSSVSRMLVGVTVALLRVVWKMRVGETKILQNGILPLCICSKGQGTQSVRSLLKRDPRNASSSVSFLLKDGTKYRYHGPW